MHTGWYHRPLVRPGTVESRPGPVYVYTFRPREAVRLFQMATEQPVIVPPAMRIAPNILFFVSDTLRFLSVAAVFKFGTKFRISMRTRRALACQ